MSKSTIKNLAMTRNSVTIGGLAKATGTKVETIRFYEKMGLLPLPARTQSNYRIYGAMHLGRLSFIRRARDLGFPLEQVRELLGLADQPDRSCAEVDVIARQHLEEVERKIADLTALRDELTDVLDHCQCGTIAHCGIIESLAPARLAV